MILSGFTLSIWCQMSNLLGVNLLDEICGGAELVGTGSVYAHCIAIFRGFFQHYQDSSSQS